MRTRNCNGAARTIRRRRRSGGGRGAAGAGAAGEDPAADQLQEGDEVVPAGQAAVVQVDHGGGSPDRVRPRLPVGAPAAGTGAGEPLAEVQRRCRRRLPVRIAA